MAYCTATGKIHYSSRTSALAFGDDPTTSATLDIRIYPPPLVGGAICSSTNNTSGRTFSTSQSPCPLRLRPNHRRLPPSAAAGLYSHAPDASGSRSGATERGHVGRASRRRVWISASTARARIPVPGRLLMRAPSPARMQTRRRPNTATRRELLKCARGVSGSSCGVIGNSLVGLV